MIRRNLYPVLEFDDNPDALINPADKHAAEKLPGDKLIISFFGEAIGKMLDEGLIEVCATLSGENPIDVYRFVDDDVLMIHGMVGCPATAGAMDVLIGMGIQKVMFCGGGGALEKGIHVGQLFVVSGAIRDEGFSYHYVEPSRIIHSDSSVRASICEYLKAHGIAYTEGLCWTTDCMFRETRDLIAYRREEGAKIVEMEQAGCIAVAQFRKIQYGAIIYGGDDVSKEQWDKGGEVNRSGVRYALIGMCKDILKIL